MQVQNVSRDEFLNDLKNTPTVRCPIIFPTPDSHSGEPLGKSFPSRSDSGDGHAINFYCAHDIYKLGA